jgi:serine/threonine protein kinase
VHTISITAPNHALAQSFSDAHGPLPEKALAAVAAEVLKVVRACHVAGLLHGDVKPANFCLKHATLNPLADPNGDYSDYLTASSVSWLKAVDFGCSQILPGEERCPGVCLWGIYLCLCRAGMSGVLRGCVHAAPGFCGGCVGVCSLLGATLLCPHRAAAPTGPGRLLGKRTGTPVYMAPEIYGRQYDARADMWSVGVMLYQLFAQRFPFWPDMAACRASKLEEVAAAVTGGPDPIGLDYGPWLRMSAAGRDFVGRCLQRDPAQRLTVDQALAHPWLAQQLARPDSGAGVGVGVGVAAAARAA